MAKNYFSKHYTQTLYRKAESDKEKIKVHDIDTTLPDLSHLTPENKSKVSDKIKKLDQKIRAKTFEDIEFKVDYLGKILKKCGLTSKQKKNTKKEPSITEIWKSSYSPILNSIKLALLEQKGTALIKKFSLKISYVIKRYAKHLPTHVATSEIDDLNTIAQLEFIETFKAWDPEKSDNVWTLAYTRITGAMKDHIRYITKSDPSRFYDWVTDAAYIYMNQNKGPDFEYKIETGDELNRAMKVLTPREKKIVIAYTKEDKTFQEIATKIGVSESQISRIYKGALKKLKKALTKES